MIVNCPSCTTLYRYQPPEGVLAIQAQCSGCDTTFDLEPLRRAYAIVDAATGTAVPAPAVSTPVPSAEAPSAAAVTVEGPGDAAVEPPVAEAAAARGEAEHWTPPDGMKLGTFDYDPAADQAEAVPGDAAETGRSRFGEWLTTLFLGSVGGGSGYYLAVLQEADLVTFIAGGSAVGLLCGWAVIRWMARES